MVGVRDGRTERAWSYGVELIDTTALIDKPIQRAVGVYFPSDTKRMASENSPCQANTTFVHLSLGSAITIERIVKIALVMGSDVKMGN